MAREIDERIVQMQFDNKEFEEGIKTTMGSLGKLKESLKFENVSEGFDSLQEAIDGLDFSNLIESSAVAIETFLQIHRHLDNIIQKVESGIKSLSIDQVNAGWSKYEDKTSAVQTIMAATASDYSDTAEQMKDVNSQLEKLNWFTDETSYNFVEMTNNIGKFTSNGIKLSDAVTNMQGIATWAAISGANSGEASRAMYNLSQAISTGAVKLIDWKSIENANMSTLEFKQNVIDTALALGTLKKAEDGTIYSSAKKDGTLNEVSATNFNDALKDEWFTSDVLLKVLDKYGKFTDELYAFANAADEVGGYLGAADILQYTQDFVDGTLDMKEVMSESGLTAEELTSWFEKLSSSEYELGRKSFKAAQEAKTFTEALDSVKDAVSTGWMNTFETIFGDYEQARVLWTDVANGLYDVFAVGGENRNKILKKWANTLNENNEDGRKLFLKGIGNVLSAFTDSLNVIRKRFHIDFLGIEDELDFTDTMADRLFKLTEAFSTFSEKFKMSESTIASMETVLSRIIKTFKNLASPVVNVAGKVFGAIETGIENISPYIAPVAEKVSYVMEILSGAFARASNSFIGKAFTWIGDRINDIIGWFGDLAAKASEIELPGWMQSIIDIGNDVWDWLVRYANGEDMSDPTAPLADSMELNALRISKSGKSVTDVVMEIMQELHGNDPERHNKLTALGYAADTIQGVVNDIITPFGEMKEGWEDVLAKWSTVPADVYTGPSEEVLAFGKQQFDNLKNNTFGTKGQYYVEPKKVRLFTDVLIDLRDKIIKLKNDALSKIPELFHNIGEGIGYVVVKIREWWPIVNEKLGAGADWVLGKWESVTSGIKKNSKSFSNGFKNTFLLSIGKGSSEIKRSLKSNDTYYNRLGGTQLLLYNVGKGLATIFGKLTNLGKKLWDNIGPIWDSVKQFSGKVFSKLTIFYDKTIKFINDITPGITKNFKNLTTGLKNLFSDVDSFDLKKIVSKLPDMFKLFGTFFSESWSLMWENLEGPRAWFDSLKVKIVEFFTGLKGTIEEKAPGVFESLSNLEIFNIDNIKQAFVNVATQIEEFIYGVIKWFAHLFGIELEEDKNSMGVFASISHEMELVGSDIEAFVEQMGGTEALINTANQAVKDATGGLVDPMGMLKEGVKNLINETLPAGSLATELSGAIDKGPLSIANSLVSGLTGTNPKDTVDAITNEVLPFISDLSGVEFNDEATSEIANLFTSLLTGDGNPLDAFSNIISGTDTSKASESVKETVSSMLTAMTNTDMSSEGLDKSVANFVTSFIDGDGDVSSAISKLGGPSDILTLFNGSMETLKTEVKTLPTFNAGEMVEGVTTEMSAVTTEMSATTEASKNANEQLQEAYKAWKDSGKIPENETVEEFKNNLIATYGNLSQAFSSENERMLGGVEGVAKSVGTALNGIKDAAGNIDINKIMEMLGANEDTSAGDKIRKIISNWAGIARIIIGIRAFFQVSSLIKGAAKTMNETGKILEGYRKDKFGDKVEEIKNTVLEVAKAFIMICGAIFVLAIIPRELFMTGLKRAAIIAVGIIAFYALLSLVGKMGENPGEKLTAIAKAIAEIGGAMFVMYISVNQFAKMDPDDLVKGLGSVVLILGIVALFSFIIGGGFKKTVQIAGSGIGKILKKTSIGNSLMSKFSGSSSSDSSSSSSSSTTSSVGSTVATIVELTALIKILVGVVKTFGSMDPATVAKGLFGLFFLLLEVGLFTRLMSKNVVSTTGLIGLAVAMGILAGVVWILGTMKAEDALQGILVIAALFAAIIGLSKLMGTALDVKSIIGLVIVIGAVSLLFIALTTLSKIGISFLTVKAIAAVIGAVGGLLISLSKALTYGRTLGVLGAMKGGASLALGFLTFIGTLGGICGALLALKDATNGQIDVLGFVFDGLTYLLDSAEVFLVRFVEVCGKILEVGATGLGAALGGFVGAIVGEFQAQVKVRNDRASYESMGYFFNMINYTTFPDKEKMDQAAYCIQKLIELENQIPESTGLIGYFFGGEITWDTVSKGLKDFGIAMVKFSVASGYIDKDNVQKGVDAGGLLNDLLHKIPAKTTKINTWFGSIEQGGELSWSTISDGLVTFARAMVGFSWICITLNKSGLDIGVTSGTALAKLLNGVPQSPTKFLNWFQTGGASWDTISTGLVDFARAMVGFAFTCLLLNKTGFQKGIDAAGPLKDLLDALPEEPTKIDTWFGSFITGGKSWSTISTGLADFGTAMSKFSSACKDIDKDKVSVGVAAGKELNGLMTELEDTPFKYENWFADKQLDQYSKTVAQIGGKDWNNVATGLEGFGSALARFSNNDIDPDKIDKLVPSFDSLQKLVVAANETYYSDAVAGLGTLVEDIRLVGESDGLNNIATFFNEFNSVDEVTARITAVQPFIDSMQTMFKSSEDANISNIDAFFSDLVDVADAIKDVSADQFIGFGNVIMGLGGIDVNALFYNLQDANGMLIQNRLAQGITGFLKHGLDALDTSTSYKTDPYAAGKYQAFADNIISGLEKAMDETGIQLKVRNTAKYISDKVTAALSYYKGSMVDTGAYLVQGFIDGMESKRILVNDTASSIASGASQRMRMVLKVKSPSKVTEEIGMYTALGFAQGISSNQDVSYNAAESLATNSTSIMQEVMERASLMLNDDVRPVITPVVDMSNVASSAGYINGMFGTRQIGSVSFEKANEISMYDYNTKMDTMATPAIDHTPDIITAINNIQNGLNVLSENMGGLQVVMDGGALVGAIAPNMDKALNTRQMYNRRRN